MFYKNIIVLSSSLGYSNGIVYLFITIANNILKVWETEVNFVIYNGLIHSTTMLYIIEILLFVSIKGLDCRENSLNDNQKSGRRSLSCNTETLNNPNEIPALSLVYIYTHVETHIQAT